MELAAPPPPPTPANHEGASQPPEMSLLTIEPKTGKATARKKSTVVQW